ncbi:COX15/CtaA family protein [Gracilimonas mengyeensis]|uniref:Cytochrome c oxidase assembly protein subunit 15 n=1 Tax=Gracilimonas mengyeensis TaxID=1302730 RepID=A0A521D3W1_9BACT|nr:COX15/CtaA family protein [Gracilimonas mengyeensis]SMO66385.1 cytochrome c oxidase assembly protein subunit 15 [Gracilimonas mengyeensis]
MNYTFHRSVYVWLWTGIILISLMIIIGGVTRLTDSGLSMSDWNLIMGSIPPMNETDWQQTFERYKEFPQYQQLNAGMSLEKFKGIYFWEYLHRVLGRVVGIVFLIPFGYFWAKGYFDSRLLKRMFILLGLGALQGAMGWIMVKSGLVDIPYVSHYRLAAHFMLAFILIGFCLWYALDLRNRSIQVLQKSILRKWLSVVGVLFIIQLIYGAFTAGLDAGYIYNTFPKMAGQWIPPTLAALDPFLLNLIENPGTVQWIHRVTGTLLLISVVIFWWKSAVQQSKSKWLQAMSGALLTIILLQYLVGVLTLVNHVPISLGVLHQGIAILFWIIFLTIAHRLKY